VVILAEAEPLVQLQAQVLELVVLAGLEFALEKPPEVQAELVVAQAALVEQVEVNFAGLEREQSQEADAQQVGMVQCSQTGILEGSQVLW
jgi:hypothetical protein